MIDEYGEWCDSCGRRVGVACNCKLTFKEKMAGLQVDKFSLLDRDRKLKEPKNRGLERRLK